MYRTPTVASALAGLLLNVMSCGGSNEPSRSATDPAATSSADQSEAQSDTAASVDSDLAVMTDGPDTQPVQPEQVPTPIEGVLGNQWQCSGEVNAARLQSQLDAAAADFRACFVEAMVESEISKVAVQLLARVGKDGRVTDHVVRSTPDLRVAIACTEKVLRGLTLVRPKGGSCVVLDYPLTLSISY